MILDLGKEVNVAFIDDDEDDFYIFCEAAATISANIVLQLIRDCNGLLQQNLPHEPQLIFLDLNLGATTGLECLKQIRKMPNLLKVPIIIQSTFASQQTIDECFKCGANYYLKKPVNYGVLESELRNILLTDWNM
jgi:CheY-like chemotaxis protein